MKPPVNQTDTQLERWLNKTGKSIGALVARTGSVEVYPIYALVDRFTELKEEAQRRGIWNELCERRGWAVDHDAYDWAA